MAVTFFWLPSGIAGSYALNDLIRGSIGCEADSLNPFMFIRQAGGCMHAGNSQLRWRSSRFEAL
jgi:hypothetical protein